MSLIKCKGCGKEYSSSAKACPHCGKHLTSGSTKFIGGLVALIIIFAIWTSHRNQEEAERIARIEATRQAAMTPEQRERQRVAKEREVKLQKAAEEKGKRFSAARGACLLSLKTNLHDPDSAKLDSTYTWYVEERKNGTILVQPTGRAKNAFGAYIKGAWNCVTKQHGNDIVVLSLKQIRP